MPASFFKQRQTETVCNRNTNDANFIQLGIIHGPTAILEQNLIKPHKEKLKSQRPSAKQTLMIYACNHGLHRPKHGEDKQEKHDKT